MTPNRTAPAYQEYAASMMARFEYRTLTLAQRGLLYSLRLECWVNQFLPDSPEVIARMLGFDPAEIVAEIPFVMPFFDVQNGRVFAPDLEAYRERLNFIKDRQAQGGRAGAKKTNTRKTRASKGSAKRSSNPLGEPAGALASDCRVVNLTQHSLSLAKECEVVEGTGDIGGSGVSSDITLSPGWEVDHGL